MSRHRRSRRRLDAPSDPTAEQREQLRDPQLRALVGLQSFEMLKRLNDARERERNRYRPPSSDSDLYDLDEED